MNDDVLDIVFEEDRATLYNENGDKLGKRRKLTHLNGNTKGVEYMGEYGEHLGGARKVMPTFGSSYVEFYDKDGKAVGKAYVDERYNGTRQIRYTDMDGRTVKTREVDEDAVKRNSRHDYMDAETNGRISSDSSNSSSGSSGYVSQEPAYYGGGGSLIVALIRAVLLFISPFIVLFIIGAVADLSATPLGKLLENPDKILRVMRVVTLFISIPLAGLLVFMRTRRFAAVSAGVGTYRIIHIILGMAAVAATAKMASAIMVPGDYGMAGWQGVKLYLLAYIPPLAYTLLNRFVGLFARRSKNSHQCRLVREDAGILTVFMCVAVIFLARATVVFLCKYTPDFADAMFFIFRTAGHLVIAGCGFTLLKEIVEAY